MDAMRTFSPGAREGGLSLDPGERERTLLALEREREDSLSPGERDRTLSLSRIQDRRLDKETRQRATDEIRRIMRGCVRRCAAHPYES
jgi:hypothetical protein